MAEAVVFSVIQSLEKLKSYEERLTQSTREQLDAIDSILKRLQVISKIADARLREDDWIRSWVAETREAAYAVEDLLNGSAMKVSKTKKSIITRWHSKRKLETFDDAESKLSSREIIWEACKLGSVNQAEIETSASNRFCGRDFVGLDQDVEELVVQLINEDGSSSYRVISIIGRGGIGKTALAKKIYYHDYVRGYYSAFAWVIISKHWQLEEVFQRILCKLVPENREHIGALENITELRNELFDVLETKKCLVVLDDVGETEIWGSLKHAFLNCKSTSKLLITTRDKEISLRIGEDICYLYEQRGLNEEESWELFQRKVSPSINIPGRSEYASRSISRFYSCISVVEEDEYLDCLDTPLSECGIEGEHEHASSSSFRTCNSFVGEDEFLDCLDASLSEDGIEDVTAQEMVRQCGGLPLAIDLLGGILATKPSSTEWEAFQKSYISHLRERETGENQKVFEKLALSYHELPYQIKQCFWYLSNFPEHYTIPTQNLYQLWAAEGFILPNPGNECESITDVAESYLSELEQSCMVQVQMEESTMPIKSCRLSELVREICILKGNEENFRRRVLFPDESELGASSSESTSTNSSEISIPVDSSYEMILISEREKVEHVRSALVYSRTSKSREIQSTLKRLCDSYKLLRVFHLERFNLGDELCASFTELVQLRYLSFRNCRFTKLSSSIGDFEFLQTLDLRVAFHSKLIIPDVLWKLNNLRHLYLPPQQKETNRLRLTSLRYLETLKNFDQRVSGVEGIPLDKLRKLTVIFYNGIENLKKCFRINSTRLIDFSIRIHYDFNSAQELNLLALVVRCAHLRKLDLVGQIKVLPEDDQFAESLAKLTLRNSELVEDPFIILEKLPNLYSLTLRNNAYVGRRFCCSAQGFRKLIRLELQCLTGLEDWIMEEGSMCNLTQIKIDGCTKLKRLPEGIKFLGKIREIKIANMPEGFKHAVESVQDAGAKNLDKVVFTATYQTSDIEFEQHKGRMKLPLFASISPSTGKFLD